VTHVVQNGRGALVPPDGYWQELRRICDTHGVLLVADEVITSFGRVGHWFASERFGVVPDVITFAKGVTSAYLPLGGMLVRTPHLESVWNSEVGAFLHGSTFGGHPASTAVAAANIAALESERVLDNVDLQARLLRNTLDRLLDAHDCVGEIRGTGFLHAIELTASRERGRPLTDAQHSSLRSGLLGGWVRDAGVLVRPDDRGATMLIIAPPLIATPEVIADLGARLDHVLAETDAWLSIPHTPSESGSHCFIRPPSSARPPTIGGTEHS